MQRYTYKNLTAMPVMRKRLYKAKKNWLVAGTTTFALAAGLFAGGVATTVTQVAQVVHAEGQAPDPTGVDRALLNRLRVAGDSKEAVQAEVTGTQKVYDDTVGWLMRYWGLTPEQYKANVANNVSMKFNNWTSGGELGALSPTDFNGRFNMQMNNDTGGMLTDLGPNVVQYEIDLKYVKAYYAYKFSTTSISATVGSVTKPADGTNTFTQAPTVTLSQGTAPTLTADAFDWSQVGTTPGSYRVTLNATGIARINAALASQNLTLSAGQVIAGTAIITQPAPTAITATVGNVEKTFDGTPTFTTLPRVTLSQGTLPTLVASDFDFNSVGSAVGSYSVGLSAAGIAKINAANTGANLTLVAGRVTKGTATIKEPAKTAITATVGPATKTYDGLKTFTTMPTVTLSNGATVPCNLTLADFDFAVPSANAGTYTGVVKLKASGIAKIEAANPTKSLAASAVTAGNAVINKAKATITATANSKEEGQGDPTLSAKVVGAVNNETLGYTVKRAPGETVGKYNMTVVLTAAAVNNNYDIQLVGAEFEIKAKAKQAISATLKDVTVNYAGAQTLNTIMASNQIGINFANLPSTPAWVNPPLEMADFDLTKVKNAAGTYSYTLKASAIAKILTANPGVTLATSDIHAGTITVNKIAATITPVDASKAFGDADPTLTATVTGVVSGDTLDYKVVRQPGETAGPYTETIELGTGAVNNNYTITKGTGTFTIKEPTSAGHLQIRVKNATLTYAGASADIAAALTAGGEFGYAFGTTPNGYTPIDATNLTIADYDLSAVSTAAGTYSYTLKASGIAKLKAANPRVTIDPADVVAGKITINKAKVTVTADDYARDVNAPDAWPRRSTVTEGQTFGEQLAFTIAREPGESVGTYRITLTPTDAAVNKNFDITVKPGTYTITGTPAPTDIEISATVGTVSKPADGTATFTAVPSVTLSNAALTVPTLTASDFDWSGVHAAKGSYPVTLSDAGIAKINAANRGYKLEKGRVTAGTATITAGTVTVTLKDFTAPYSGTITTFGTPGGNMVGSSGQVQLTREDFDWTGVQPDVGTYTVTLSAAGKQKISAASDGANVTVARAATLTVTPAPITLTANDKTIRLGDSITGLTASKSNFPRDGKEPVYTVAVVGNVTAAGTYPIRVTAKAADNPNYTITVVDGTLTVQEAPVASVDVSMSDWSAVYNGLTTNFGGPRTSLTAHNATGNLAQLTADDYDWSGVRPDVGTYTVTLSEAGKRKISAAYGGAVVNITQTAKLTVTPAPITLTANDKIITLGDSLEGLTARKSNFPPDGVEPVYTVKVSGTVAAAGTYPIKVTAPAASNPNYTITVVDGTLTVREAPVASVEVALEDWTATYNGKTTNFGTPGAHFTLHNANGNLTSFTASDFDWSGVRADVGQYTVTLSETGKQKVSAAFGNANVTVSQTAKLTVKPAAITIKANNKTITLGDSTDDLKATVSGKPVDGVTPTYTVKVDGTVAAAGTYPIKVIAPASSNPNYLITVEDGTLTVNEAPVASVDVALDDWTATYNGTTTNFGGPDAHFIAHNTTGRVSALTAADFDWSGVRADAGTYTVGLSAAGKAKVSAAYGGATVNVTQTAKLTVKPAAITIKANNKTITLGDSTDGMTATVSGKPTAGVVPTYTVKVTGNVTAAGTYPIKVTAPAADNPNYVITVEDGTLTVEEAPVKSVDVALKDFEATYDGTIANFGTPGAQFTAHNTTGNLASFTASDFDWSGVQADAGSYTVGLSAAGKAKVAAAFGGANVDVTRKAKLTVKPRAITIKATDKTITLGDSTDGMTATISGKPGAGVEPTYTVKVVGTVNAAGRYAIKVTAPAADNPNYLITVEDGTLTVNEAPVASVDVALKDFEATYNGKTDNFGTPGADFTVHNATGNLASFTASDFDWSGVHADAGTYTVGLSATGKAKIAAAYGGANVNVTRTAKLTVKPARITIKATDKTITLGDSTANLKATVSGKPTAGVEPTYTVDVTGTVTAAGTYPIKVNAPAASNPNYIITVQDGTLTVEEAPVKSVDVALKDFEATYDGTIANFGTPGAQFTAHNTTGNLASFTASDFDWTGVHADAGSYTVGLSTAGKAKVAVAFGGANVDVTRKAKLTVKPRAITIKATDKTITLGDSTDGMTATVSGKPGAGVEPTYTVKVVGTVNAAGRYAIKVTAPAADNPNYLITVEDGTLTVNEAPVASVDVALKDFEATYNGTTTNFGTPGADFTVHNTTGNLASLTASDFDWSGVHADAGTYTVGLSATGKAKIAAAYGGANVNVTRTAKLTVKPARITIKATDKTITLGDSTANLKATVSGKPTAGVEPTYTVDVTGTVTAAGTYPIKVNAPAASNPNYIITVQDGTLTVEEAPVKSVDVALKDFEATYDGTIANFGTPGAQFTAHNTTGNLASFTASDFDWSGVHADAGSYTVGLSAAGKAKVAAAFGGANVDVTRKAKLTVKPRAITIKATDKTITLGDSTDGMTATVSGKPGAGVEPTYTVKVAGTVNAAGRYAIKVTAPAADNPNYLITVEDGTLTVNEAPVASVDVALKDFEATYNGKTDNFGTPGADFTVHNATGNLASFTASDFDWSGVHADAGTYTVGLSATGKAKIAAAYGGANVNVTRTAKLTVKPARITIKATDKTITLGDSTANLKATVSGKPTAGVEPTYTVDVTGTVTAAGTYPIKVNAPAASNPNYIITVQNGTLTVKSPAPAPTVQVSLTDVVTTYDGTTNFANPAVTVTGGNAVTWTHADFDWSQAQANVGTYTITLSEAGKRKLSAANGNATVSVTHTAKLTVQPAELTIKAVDKTITLGDPLTGMTATVTGKPSAGVAPDYTVAVSGTVTTPGTYVIKVTAPTATNPNYHITTVAGTLTVKAPAPVIKDLSATVGNIEKTYDGTRTFATLPRVTLSDLTATVPPLAWADFDFSSTSANAGTMRVTLNASGIAKILAANANTTLTAARITAGTATINKKAVTLTADSLHKVAGTSDPTLTATANGVVPGETLGYTLRRDPGETVGTYAITATLTGAAVNDNYTITLNRGTFTITPSGSTTTELRVKLGDYSAIYNGTKNFANPTMTLTGTTSGSRPVTLTHDDFDWGGVQADVGTYRVTLSAAGIAKLLAANPGTVLTTPNITAATLTVTPAEMTITAQNVTVEEGKPLPPFTATVNTAVTGGVPPVYTVTRSSNSLAPGTYTLNVNAPAPANPNYRITVHAGTLTITPKPVATPLTATVGTVTKTYDGGTAFATLPRVTLSHEATVPSLTASDFDWTAVRANAGEYRVTLNASGIAKILAANPNTALAASAIIAGKAIIDKAEATITVHDKTKTVGTTDPDFTARVSGAVAGETLDYTLSRTGGETAGQYEIIATPGPGAVNANYTITVVKGHLTITEAPVRNLTAKVGTVTKTYDGTATFTTLPTVTLSSGAIVPTLTASDFDWSAVRANAATYAVSLSKAGIRKIVAANAGTALVEADITDGSAVINKAAATITAQNASKAFGAADPTLTATVSGAVAGETLKYTVTRAPGETAGTYTITVTPTGDAVNANYTINTVAGRFTIEAPTQLSATVGNLEKTYDGTATFTTLPTVTLTGGTGTVPTLTTDDFDWRDVGANAGTYRITLSARGLAKLAAANPTAQISNPVTAGTVTINKAAATLTAVDATKAFGAADPTLMATVTGAVNGETLQYRVTRAPGETAGTYVITVTATNAAVNANYTFTTNPGRFTIAEANTLVATVGDVTKTYDGTATLTTVPTVTLMGGTVPTLTLADFDLTAVGKNAGTYTITLNASGLAKLRAANPTATIASTVTAGKVTVNKAKATITAADATKVAGTADPTLRATVNGAVAGETLQYTVTRTSGETAGTYTITVTPTNAAVNANYELTLKPGKFVITEPTAHTLTITVGNAAKTYDGTTNLTTLPTVTLAGGTGTVPTLTQADFDLTAVGKNVGTYTLTLNASGLAKLRAANPTATIAPTVTTGKLTVNKAKATIRTKAASKVIGEADPALSATVTGAIAGDSLAYKVTRQAGESIGTYTQTVTLEAGAAVNANYEITVVNDPAAVFTIKAASNGSSSGSTGSSSGSTGSSSGSTGSSSGSTGSSSGSTGSSSGSTGSSSGSTGSSNGSTGSSSGSTGSSSGSTGSSGGSMGSSSGSTGSSSGSTGSSSGSTGSSSGSTGSSAGSSGSTGGSGSASGSMGSANNGQTLPDTGKTPGAKVTANAKSLPQTGEAQATPLAALGAVVLGTLGAAGAAGLRRKRDEEEAK